MEQLSGSALFSAGILIEGIKTESLLGSLAVPPDAEVYNYAAPLAAVSVERAIRCFEELEKQCRGLGLDLSARALHDAGSALENPAKRLLNCQWLRDQVYHLRTLIKRELSNNTYFRISAERMKFWPPRNERHAFGDRVADAFGSSTEDAGCAGICLAIQLPSASVFHSMRVLEVGLSAFGALFGVSLAHTNWGPALGEIESKIREMGRDPAWKAMSDWKQRQESYAQAASHFGILKDAWRNYTMHARGNHSDRDAEMIFLNVGGFMQKLAALGIKEDP